MSEPTLTLNFLYLLCTDVDVMRPFYSEVLGLDERSYMKQPGFGWLNYDCGSCELMFFDWDAPLPVEARWAWQPGGFDLPEGEKPAALTSFSIQVPEERFAETVARLRAADGVKQTEWPVWRQDSYWGWTVKDPQGNTIEVYSKVTERPAGDPVVWPEAE